ncbi:MAG TPA: hypothetical protein VIE65_20760 [Methylobacter sp.]
MTSFSTTPDSPKKPTVQASAARGIRRALKFCIAVPVIAAPFVFPKLSPILVPVGIVTLIILFFVGPKSERKWKWVAPESHPRSRDEDGSPETTDLNPANPFGMHDFYHSSDD